MDANSDIPNAGNASFSAYKTGAADSVAGSTEADIERLRGEIGETLRALEDKLNVGKKLDDAIDSARDRASALRDNNPVAFIAGVAGIAVLAGTTIWAVARKLF